MQFQWTFKATEPIHLKNFLRQRGVSHRLFLKLRNNNNVKVNQKIQRTNVLLKYNDLVGIDLPPEDSDPTVLISNGPIDVAYEDSNWLIVNKPAGLTSVPGPSNREDTLVNRVKGYLINHGSENIKPHLISRLDRYTSGLLLIAKNQLANSIAVQMNQERKIHKRYLAVVSGIINDDQGIIDRPIGRVDNQIQRQILEDGQSAITEFKVLKRLDDRTLVELTLRTGRTHQIRVHLASIGHPLIGDQLYDGPIIDGVDHQALDAHQLTFVDPFYDKEVMLKTRIPAEIVKLIQ